MQSKEHEHHGGRRTQPSRSVLVIGYGSTLRGDDAAGPAVAQRVADWDLPGVTTLAPIQLTPDLASDIAVHDLVVFVDAAPADNCPHVQASRLVSGAGTLLGAIGHAGDPTSLLDLADSMYGRRPETWQIAIPAYDMSVGEHVSEQTGRHIESALTTVRHLVDPADAAPEHSHA